MCKTYRDCKANAPRKEGSLSCRKKGAELSRHTHLICFIFLHNSGCDGCDKYKVWLIRIKKGTFVYACLGHGCDGGFTLVPGNVKGRGFKSLNNVDHHE